jgi:hypothetical protein
MNTLRFFLMVLIFILVACGSSHKLSNKIARKKIQELGLVEFNDKELDIQNISQIGSKQAVAEVNLKMAFQLSKSSSNQWEIEAIRLGHRNWINVKTFLHALDMTRGEQTRKDLRRLVVGIKTFKNINGFYPKIKKTISIVTLTDILFPRYLSTLIRYDGWGREFIVQIKNIGDIRIISTGPDMVLGTEDDIFLTI